MIEKKVQTENCWVLSWAFSTLSWEAGGIEEAAMVKFMSDEKSDYIKVSSEEQGGAKWAGDDGQLGNRLNFRGDPVKWFEKAPWHP